MTGGDARTGAVPALTWGRVAAVLGTLLAIRLVIKGASALVSMAYNEARYRLQSGRFPSR